MQPPNANGRLREISRCLPRGRMAGAGWIISLGESCLFSTANKDVVPASARSKLRPEWIVLITRCKRTDRLRQPLQANANV